MAYLGSTAASSISNPPRILAPMDTGRIGSSAGPIAGRLWLYTSTGANSSDPFTANYFSDALYIGMKEGDIVMYSHRNSTVTTSQIVGMGVVGAVSTAGACLSTFSFMTST
jgi:hypothetical protein